MVVNNKTHLSGEKINSVLTKSARKTIFQRYSYVSIIFVSGFVILILGLIENNREFILFGGLFTAFSLIWCIYNTIQLNKVKKKIASENKLLLESGIDYNFTFKEKSINIEAIELNKKNKSVYQYQDIKKVFEFNDYFEIVFKDTLVCYISKDGFENPRMIDFFKKNITLNKKKIINKIS